MAATLTPEQQELRQNLAALEAHREQQERAAREADREQAQRAAAERIAQQTADLDSIDMSQHDEKVWHALDALAAAARALTEASAQREAAKDTAVEVLRRYADSPRVQTGPTNALDRRRIASQKKEEITELAHILAPLIYSIGGQHERLLVNALEDRKRGGNRIRREAT